MKMRPGTQTGFLLCGKEWTEGEALEVRSPWDQGLVGRVTVATRADARQAVNHAVASLRRTRALPRWKRREILEDVAAALIEQKERFAQLIVAEAGKPVRLARTEVDRAVLTFKTAAEEAARLGGESIPLDLTEGNEGRWGLVQRFPVGPVLAITPFNFPLNLVAHKLAPAMAAGCPVILKPAPQTPFTALALGEVILKAGWPAEALAVLPLSNADTAWLAEKEDRIKLVSFTGSAKVGWELEARSGRKRACCWNWAALPPNSSRTRLRPERRFELPTNLAEPVKLTSLMLSSFSASHAASALLSGSTASASTGQPALRITSPSAKAVNGVCGAGLRITGQPAAIAGATLWATRFRGKLKGVMASTGPMGKRCTSPQRPSLPSIRSSGMLSPPSREASSAAVLKVSTARSTSARAMRTGLPASATINCAKRSFCSMSAAATSSRISRRFQRGRARARRRLATAWCTAWRASARVAIVTRPTSPLSHGERTSRASPSLHSLPHSKKPVCDPGRILMAFDTSFVSAVDSTLMGRELSSLSANLRRSCRNELSARYTVPL